MEQKAELRRLWAEGVRDQALATAFGRSAGAVKARINLLGLKRLWVDPATNLRWPALRQFGV